MTRVVMSEAEFRRLWSNLDVSVDRVADRLGVTRQAVQARARVRGLAARPCHHAYAVTDPMFPVFYRGGVGTAELARHYRCTKKAVTSRAKFLGLPVRDVSFQHGISMREFLRRAAVELMAAEAAKFRKVASGVRSASTEPVLK